ncbi:Cro/CI family transcriptional regulator [Klebsiella sp. BIGb0407]|uniref:Cro/CI family transcriptional regulator n=1 Tax=Klebsiella sp. BIGb0407 TaxID=2940603 RepID=UPI00216A9E33|nr:Cro/CI family transcriptional regulator [Klebsiella sp. BIGb0407]MCS3433677.1 hypothetical protein [Klebsiella sp. BIGb0407]
MFKTDVVNHFGGVAKTAVALGISHPAVCRWGVIIPERQALRIEKLTRSKLQYDQRLYLKNSDTKK